MTLSNPIIPSLQIPDKISVQTVPVKCSRGKRLAKVIRHRFSPPTTSNLRSKSRANYRLSPMRRGRIGLTKGHTARLMTNDRPLRRFRGHPVVPTLPRVERKKLITINRRDAAIPVFRVSPALRPLSRAECLVHPRDRVRAKFITLRRPRHD